MYEKSQKAMEMVIDTYSIEVDTLLQRGLQRAQTLGRPVVVSWVEPIPSFDPMEIFERGQRVTQALQLWAQPTEAFALVGVGVAYDITVEGAERFKNAAATWSYLLTEALIENPANVPGVGPVVLGGFAFDEQLPSTPLWDGYPDGQLVLPQLLFTQAQGETWLTWNLVVEPDSDLHTEYAALLWLRDTLNHAVSPLRRPRQTGRLGPTVQAPTAITRHDLRLADDWQTDVANAAQTIQRAELEKVVLARGLQLQAVQAFQAPAALRHLAANYTGCYIFAIARGNKCFLGATPEQLVRLRQREVQTMALAGSIRRGTTSAEDQRLGQELLASAKDRIEHSVVVQAIIEALGATCLTPTYNPQPSLFRLGNIQHLCTPIVGRLANGYTLLDLVERLHPTPAVGGRPREAALQLIREHEKLDRGWYAGPVGWLDAQGAGEFAVALRVALLDECIATLFAGCGIMADSDPEREYAEAELKFKPMLVALTQA